MCVDIVAHIGTGHEFNALSCHQVETALNDLLVELHIGDAVHQQATNAIRSFQHLDAVARFVELIGSCQARRSGTDDHHFLACPAGGWFWLDPSFGKATVNNGVFNVLDRDCGIGDPQDAGTFTGSRTGAAREFRKIVGFMKPVKGFLPATLVNQVVPFRNQVIDRTARSRLAKGDTAIHAASSLSFQVALLGWGKDFVIVFQPDQR